MFDRFYNKSKVNRNFVVTIVNWHRETFRYYIKLGDYIIRRQGYLCGALFLGRRLT